LYSPFQENGKNRFNSVTLQYSMNIQWSKAARGRFQQSFVLIGAGSRGLSGTKTLSKFDKDPINLTFLVLPPHPVQK